MRLFDHIKEHGFVYAAASGSCIIILAVVCITMFGKTAMDSVSSDQEKWTVKQKETFSRLLNVPIILYHDIDGKGPYAVTSAEMKKQFRYFRDNGIKVVSLKDLISRLETPRPYEGRVIVITFDDGYKSMYTKLLPLVREFGYPVTLFVYTDFISERGKSALTWDNLREMQKSGIDIQCHTQSHIDLVKLAASDFPSDRNKMYNEIYLSRKKIEYELDKKVDFLAFPFGYYNNKTIQLAKNAGFVRVFSTDDGANPLSYNNYCLRRHHIKRNYSLDRIARIIE